MGTQYSPDITLQILEMWEHKWYVSEQERQDMGEKAYADWAAYHAARFRERYEARRSAIEEACRRRCPDGCRGPAECERILSKEDLHSLLGD